MDAATFESLLGMPEGEHLDFKREVYKLEDDGGKLSLAKDVVSLANTPRDEAAYIVFGVDKMADGTSVLVGLDRTYDDERFQTLVANYLSPVPRISFEGFHYQDKEFGILTIHPDRIGPCMCIRESGGTLTKGPIYFRRGSTNAKATTAAEVLRIVEWCRGGSVQKVHFDQAELSWESFADAAHQFEDGRHYILVVPPIRSQTEEWRSISAFQWTAVFDFDADSDVCGLLEQNASESNEPSKAIHQLVDREEWPAGSQHSIIWYMARGLSGRASTVELGSWRDWQSRYGRLLTSQFEAIARDTAPSPVTLIIAWYSNELIRHLQSLMDSANSAFGGLADFIIVSDNPDQFAQLALDFDAKVIGIRVDHFLIGLSTVSDLDDGRMLEGISLPSSSGLPIPLDPHNSQFISEELELVHLGLPNVAGDETVSVSEFLRGSEVSWRELNIHSDVDRDVTADLTRIVRADLAGGFATRVNLYHAAGAGGTTVGRRIAWDLHQEFPTAVLQSSTEPHDTVERLSRVCSISGKPMILLIDSSNVAENKLDKVFEYTRARNLPVVFLQILRRNDQGRTDSSSRARTRHLKQQLSSSEANRFVAVLSREVPSRRTVLEAQRQTPHANQLSAFHFCLQAFGEQFTGLERYVQSRTTGLTTVQKSILVFLAIAHHYGQRPIPEDAFGEVLGVPQGRLVHLRRALPPDTFDLLIEDSPRFWRTSHDLIATEVLEQILSQSSGDRRVWKQGLSNWAIEFASLARGRSPVPSEQMLETARRIFVYRDTNIDVLGTERSGQRQLSNLLEDVPTNEGKLRVLEHLVELYPDEAHFLAHLGRFQFVVMKNFPAAIDAIDRALLLQPDDHVLHHMRGMADRAKVYSMITETRPLNEVALVAKQASTHFSRARELESEDDHGYISEVQMITRVLDYASRQAGKSLLSVITSPSTDRFLVEAFQDAEELLEHVRLNREGESPSQYEIKCRADIDALYGQHDRAIQAWDNLLSQQGVYAPPLRRQIAWTLLARKSRAWNDLNSREVNRIVQLMKENLEEKPDDERSLRLWLQAVRHSQNPPSLDEIIERVIFWKVNGDSLEAVYYLYVLQTLSALDGSGLAAEEARRNLDECRNRARYRRNRSKSHEWLGEGTGISRLVHQSLLGEWNRDLEFWSKTKFLARVPGVIVAWDGPQAGVLEIATGMKAFFVPARGHRGEVQGLGPDDRNSRVTCYLGFSYDGLRAWDVSIAH